MAKAEVSTLSPVYFVFTVKNRAALHIINHALEHVAGEASAASDSTVKLQAALDAGKILWQCRELVLKAAERRGPLPRLYEEARRLTVIWRHPQGGIQ